MQGFEAFNKDTPGWGYTMASWGTIFGFIVLVSLVICVFRYPFSRNTGGAGEKLNGVSPALGPRDDVSSEAKRAWFTLLDSF